MKIQSFFVLLSLVCGSTAWAATTTASNGIDAAQAQSINQSLLNKSITADEQADAFTPNLNEEKASVIITKIIPAYGYEGKPITASVSRQILKQFLKTLDPQKVFLTKQDVAALQPYKTTMGYDLEQGNLEPFFKVVKHYMSRVKDRYEYGIELLKKPNPFDFNKHDSIVIDRKKSPRASSVQELQELWRKRVKNDYLRLKLAHNSDAKIRQILTQRYTINRNQMMQIKNNEVAEIVLNSYAHTADPHTVYFSPESLQDFDTSISLSVVGIGAVIQRHGEYAQIREVLTGGPAAKSGKVQAGDLIVAVGQGDSGPMQDVVGWRVNDIVKMIRGKKGTPVRIEFISPSSGGEDGEHKIVRMIRDKVAFKEQSARGKVLEVKRDGKAYKIGIIVIPSFYEDFDAKHDGDKKFKSLTRDVTEIINNMKSEGVQGLVLDLRNDGGGSLNEAARLSGLFIGPNKPIVQVRTANGQVSEVMTPKDGTALWTGPIAVLVNKLSASASEIFAGAMKDYGRGVIVGNDTWGKGTVQTLRKLNDFLRIPEPESLGALKWTIQKFFRVNGASTQIKGVKPDIQFPNQLDTKDLGESTYDNALPWSKIAPANYQKMANLHQEIAQLTLWHNARIQKSAAWKLMLDQVNYGKTLANRKTISLNLKEREKERQEMQEKHDEFEKRRKALGESDVEVFRLDDGLSADEGNLKKELADEKKLRNNLDTAVREVAAIVADQVAYRQKQ